jgi:hypothetical protein
MVLHDRLRPHDLLGKRRVDDNVSVDGGSSVSREPPSAVHNQSMF